jgi:hypothetical protein
VDIVCEDAAGASSLQSFLSGHGVHGASWAADMASVWLPHNMIGPTAVQPGVSFLRPSRRTTSRGLTKTQGDDAILAPFGRAAPPGYTGAGIAVGTLSDSFSRAAAPLTTSAEDVVNGDLPEDVEVLRDLNGTGTDEGRAMMQIIHDIAPRAGQLFYTAFDGQADFANGIGSLADVGCAVIVDDVFYFAEPFFQDGVIAQAVNDVASRGIAYFAAAGNSGRQSYEAPLRATGVVGLSGGPLHDFDPGIGEDVFLDVTVPVGENVVFVLQWDEPFFSVSGAPGSSRDVDLLLAGSGAGLNRVLAASLANNLGGDPLEILSFTNGGTIDIDGIPGADTQFNLLIELFAGTPPQRLKFIYFDDGGVSINEFPTDSPTVVGHANATGALAVAAAPYFLTPAFGVDPARLESFSSVGGTPILFDESGARLPTPLSTDQPTFAAPDGGNTTFFGQDLSAAFPAEADSFPNFFGTSAAAPHAAAVAALMLEKAGGSSLLEADRLGELLRSTAEEMGPPGYDPESGAGLINAQAALDATPLGYESWSRREFEAVVRDPLDDDDDDGKSNAVEFYTGTVPTAADGVPPLTLATAPDGAVTVSVPVSGEVDALLGHIESTTDLVDPDWVREDVRFESGMMILDDAPGTQAKFYRLVVERFQDPDGS